MAGHPTGIDELELQPVARDIWLRKYCLRDAAGQPVEQTADDSLVRVARALAAAEPDSQRQQRWLPRFIWAMRNGAIPAGRIMANVGSGRQGVSAINCTVSGTIADSMVSILGRLAEGGLTLQSGAGIGYEFSTLRPAGSPVHGPGATSSGPVSFMRVFDAMGGAIASAGGRRGAQMATFDIGHPDVIAFIDAKRARGELTGFNLSLLVPETFMQTLGASGDWPLAFPVAAGLPEVEDTVWRRWPASGSYPRDDLGRVPCAVAARIPAATLWQQVMRAAYDSGEPGVIFIDRVNDANNTWFCESIRATNPCGEQPLPPFGACLLGSINLTRFVRAPFTANASFDWRRLRKVAGYFTRMLDNVVEMHGLPIPAQASELVYKRRHGLGYLGLGSALAMLGIRYGSAVAQAFARDVGREIAVAGWRVGVALAREKGAAPIMEDLFAVTPAMLAARPEMRDHFAVGDQVPGRVLLARYSRYMQQLATVAPDLVDAIACGGSRFTHHTSIAPTGTIALAFGNNASNGVEPSFAHHYLRRVRADDFAAADEVMVRSYEYLQYQAAMGTHAGIADEVAVALPENFVTAAEVSPYEHIDMQAAAQHWVDSAVSKTVNVAADYDFAAFCDLYHYAWRAGVKGCTTFRYNPALHSSVLLSPAERAATRFEFTFGDGRSVRRQGDDRVRYRASDYAAATLYDMLADGCLPPGNDATDIVKWSVLEAPGGAVETDARGNSAEPPFCCEQCRSRAVVRAAGCFTCLDCGASVCA